MIAIAGQPILTAAEMRAAEDAAIAAGSSVAELMDRAGRGVAEAVHRLAAGASVLILCGPGNNGGDGYVAARVLRGNGAQVRIAALGEPRTEAAASARAAWAGPVEILADAEPAPVLVDALFGTGLTRALDPAVVEIIGRHLRWARLSIAVDLPSGVDADAGNSPFHRHPGQARGDERASGFDLTLALGAVKPAHLLQPAAGDGGEVRLIELGLTRPTPVAPGPSRTACVLDRPWLPPPGPDAHKYTRGLVAIVAGAMPGATALAAESALRAGAGYALLLADQAPAGLLHAVVRRPWLPDALVDRRIGAILIGPGLGRDDAAREKLATALATDHALVIDGDALHLLDLDRLADRMARTVLTPHAGEFTALFGDGGGSKIDRARAAAARSGATLVFKGADTVIAAPDGEAIVAPAGSPWLSAAGTGDVLAGVVAAMMCSSGSTLQQAANAVWLHAEAARRCGPAFVADDLARALTAARASL